ncbi:phage tail assembly chaperone [Ponticaulis sp.]|uniref:phage tail assembly chaperone n=1 Tax=Ponticaulis sp. TaxID=2020902 RepID=UPI000B685515|nr:phage tail assembly chaperone [Ponticaulis sp.]MAI90409.1 phage tail assembly chaperone [Ponticaulis sp.]OUY00111.1 MAG: hypothetical protein CBB65_08215 [Hyphomonadaceae bacterium TMED5]|tara:strand:+ start:21743 stop:21952 length:210 start_codon:yes stop_codon:yes gene_type:complete
MSTARTDWGKLLQIGLRSGLSPSAFWQLSLREWRLITSYRKRSGFGRNDLSRLIAEFPDKEASHGDERD